MKTEFNSSAHRSQFQKTMKYKNQHMHKNIIFMDFTNHMVVRF